MKKKHISNKIVEGPVDKAPPIQVIMIIWEFIYMGGFFAS